VTTEAGALQTGDASSGPDEVSSAAADGTSAIPETITIDEKASSAGAEEVSSDGVGTGQPTSGSSEGGVPASEGGSTSSGGTNSDTSPTPASSLGIASSTSSGGASGATNAGSTTPASGSSTDLRSKSAIFSLKCVKYRSILMR